MARPRKHVDTAEIVRLRLEGLSWPEIARTMRLSVGTVYQAHRKASDAPQPFKNLSKTILQTTPDDDTANPAANVHLNPVPEHSEPLENIQAEPRGRPRADRDASEVFAALWSAWRAVGAVGNLLKLRYQAEMNFRQAIAEGASVEAILEGLGRWISWWDNTGWQYCQQNLARAIHHKIWLAAPPR